MKNCNFLLVLVAKSQLRTIQEGNNDNLLVKLKLCEYAEIS